MELDLDTRAKMALLIGTVIAPLDTVDLMLPVIATALHIWSVMTANGFEIAGDNDK